MNILTEITSLLANEEKSLSSALYNIKLLASRISNSELLSWVNKELNGYNEEDTLPKYRIVDAQLVGAYENLYRTTDSKPIPTFNFPPEIETYSKTIKVRDDISVVDTYAKSKNDTISYIVPAELNAIITNIIREYNPTTRGYNLTNLRRVVSTTSYMKIISRVRNYALDLVLTLEDEMGYNIDLEEIIKTKGKANEVVNKHMTQNMIFNIGDGNIVNTGDDNKITQA